jgi:hypothetical protein
MKGLESANRDEDVNPELMVPRLLAVCLRDELKRLVDVKTLVRVNCELSPNVFDGDRIAVARKAPVPLIRFVAAAFAEPDRTELAFNT